MKREEEAQSFDRVKLYLYLLEQDDPKKCTSLKLVRFKLAIPIYSLRQIPKNSVVLNPYAHTVFSPSDRELLRSGLVAVDCSWKRCKEVFDGWKRGMNRRLPLLWAGNPIHYGHLSILSSAEALAAALFISGFKEQAKEVLSIFKWGSTFLSLNRYVLEDYVKCKDANEVLKVEGEYMMNLRFK
ncbi:MAG: DUF367 family protein [Nitrososphaerota archaeon]|nr:DUF367 family protein [Nitrososphaerales archaeon]MCX8191721.1 DUF367 family protein [Nitrososphaerales archaeon]MDW8045585.1 DUF367 family protein [Nitrososphaerota archaeon]